MEYNKSVGGLRRPTPREPAPGSPGSSVPQSRPSPQAQFPMAQHSRDSGDAKLQGSGPPPQKTLRHGTKRPRKPLPLNQKTQPVQNSQEPLRFPRENTEHAHTGNRAGPSRLVGVALAGRPSSLCLSNAHRKQEAGLSCQRRCLGLRTSPGPALAVAPSLGPQASLSRTLPGTRRSCTGSRPRPCSPCRSLPWSRSC